MSRGWEWSPTFGYRAVRQPHFSGLLADETPVPPAPLFSLSPQDAELYSQFVGSARFTSVECCPNCPGTESPLCCKPKPPRRKRWSWRTGE